MNPEDIEPFLITATPHSGTMYAARIFQAIGLDVVHEGLGKHGAVGGDYAWRQTKYEYILTLQQVRNPIDVISSLQVVGKLTWVALQNGYLPTDDEWRPLDEKDPVRGMKLWLYWNRLSERLSSYSYRVENMAECWYDILELIGLPTDLAFPYHVCTNTNQHIKRHVYSWSELYYADRNLCKEVMELAKHYGYIRQWDRN